MRVLHVVTKADVGGAQTYVLELATAQVAAGHQVAIAAGSLGAMAEEAGRRGIEVFGESSLRRDIGGRGEWRAVRSLVGRLREFRPDVVHSHSSKAGLLARVASRRGRVAAVYTAHGWPFQRGAALAQRLVSWVGESVMSRWWGEVICITEAEAALARRYRVVPRARLHVVHNGLPDVAGGKRADRRARAVDAPVMLVMVARFAPPKAQEGVLRALAMLRTPGWRMRFVGDGPGLESASVLARTLGIHDRVEFLGERRDVDALYAESDVAVLWSRYEGMPLALMEAMRAGLACVANDLPGTRLLIDGGAAGVVVPFDEAALASALGSLIDDAARRTSLASAARRRFENEFSMAEHVARVHDVYDAAITAVAGGRAGG